MKANDLFTFTFACVLAVCIFIAGAFLPVQPVQAEASGLVVTFPDGGERLPAGSTQKITWQGYPDHELELYLSTDSGKNYDLFLGKGSGGSFTWTVPDLSTDRARIQITGQIPILTHRRDPLIVEDSSDADFSIIGLPAAPTGLSAKALSDSEILLTWTDNADNETGFFLERMQEETDYLFGMHLMEKDMETLISSGLKAETIYTYMVRAFNEAGYSSYSNEASATTLQAAEPETQPRPPREPQETKRIKEPEEPRDEPKEIEDPDELEELDKPHEPDEPDEPHDFRETFIRFSIGSSDYLVDDAAETMDAAPIIQEGRTLLPIRYVAEPLGAEVEWDPEQRKVIIILADTAVELWIDQNQARVNGSYRQVDPSNQDVMPIIAPPGRTMLPLRFIAEALGCRVDWDASIQEVTVQYDPRRESPFGWRLAEPPGDCPRQVIDFEELEPGAQVFHQYGSMGVNFPFAPRIIEPEETGTTSGTKALSTYRPGEEFGGKLVIEFTTGQSCVNLFVGLLEETHGNKVLATLKAFDAETMLAIPGYGMESYPPEQVAIQQRLIGPGPVAIGTQMFVHTEDEPLIHRVELTFSGGYAPAIDDLGFATVGEPISIEAPAPEVIIETPQSGRFISGFETFPGAFDISGTIRDELKLEEVGIRVVQGDQVRDGLLHFSGEAPDYTFGGPNIHGLIFPGENQIRVWAKSFSGKYGYSETIRVHYNPLAAASQAELLILAPALFYEALEPLRDWKNSTGISAHIMTLDAIEQEARFGLPDSRDLPEQVKKTIARAYNQNDTRYVMLVGDGDRFPVRYHQAGRQGVSWGVVYPITDLYYACLFKPDGTFDHWDGNENTILGQWWEPQTYAGVSANVADNFAQINMDDCGLRPHVALGRVPASSIDEVSTYVSKVIQYEAEGTSQWFDQVVLWNSSSDFRQDHLELTYVADELLADFAAKKHFRPEGYASWSSDQQQQGEQLRKEGIMADIDQGAGFAVFFGHGSRRSLGPLSAPDIAGLQNYGRYPVFIASACDTAKFVQEHDIYQDVDGNYPPCWPHCLPPHQDQPVGWDDPRPEPAPIQPSEIDVESMAEVLLFAPDKGGVGFLGAHSGTNHASHPFVKRFIGSWNHDHATRLGDMWAVAVREFVQHYLEADHKWEQYGHVDFGRNPFQSRHIHIYVLFGDPSLRLKE